MREYENIDDAKNLAREILAGSLSPNKGCALIASIAQKLGYPHALDFFPALAHDQEGHEAFGITAEGCISDIVLACQKLVSNGN